MSKAALLLTAILLSGCMSTRIVVSPKWDPYTAPVYIDYVDTYFWGFSGHPSIDLGRVCMDQHLQAVQSVKTGEDGFLTFITLGIYAPTTVKVWCGL